MPCVSVFGHTLQDVANLAAASRFLHDVRRDHAHAIYLAVAPRSVACFSDVEALLETQEKDSMRDSLQITSKANAIACSRMRRLGINDQILMTACQIFEANMDIYLHHTFSSTKRTSEFFTLSERIRSTPALLSNLDICGDPVGTAWFSGSCYRLEGVLAALEHRQMVSKSSGHRTSVTFSVYVIDSYPID